MNYLIHQLLNAEEINLIKKELEKCSQQDWEDGKKTAGSHASMVKNNLQLNRNTEVSKKNAQLVTKKILSSKLIKSFPNKLGGLATLPMQDIKEAILETQKINNMTDSAHARVMITRGDKIKPFQQPSLSTSGINFIIIMEHSFESPNLNGIKLVTVPQVRGLPMSQDPKLNSHSKLNCIIACIQANKAGGDEALMLDPYGFVNTTNSCNFFIVKNNEVWTSTGDYCMNGITRKKVIELCNEHKIPIYEKNFSLVDVYSAQEAFITGTLGSLTQVTSIDDRSIGSSDEGWPITSKLRQAYKKLINA